MPSFLKPFGGTPKNRYLGSLMPTASSASVPSMLPQPKIVSQLPGSGPTTGGTGPMATPSPAKTQYVNDLASTAGLPTQGGAPGNATTLTPTIPPAGTTQGNPAVGANGTANNTAGPANNAYKSAFDEYIASLKPSDAENQATKYLNDLVLNRTKTNLDIQNRPGQTTSFVGAEQERANQNAALDIDSATNALNAFTSSRSANADIAKARADYEKSVLPEKQSITDQYGSGSIGEYNFAKSQGYTGSFTDYQNEDANRKAKAAGGGQTFITTPGEGGTLSPLAQAVQNGTITLDKVPIAQRSQVAAELATSGIQNSRQQALTSNLGAVNALLDNPNKNKISGYIQGKLGLGNFDPNAQLALNQFNQLKGILSLENRQQLKGQGAISDFEFKVLSDAATALDRNLSDSDFNAQLEKIRDVFEGKYKNNNQTSTSLPASPQSTNSGITPSGISYQIIP